MFLGLGHRAVGCADHQDRAVHLGSTSDHVFDKVGVARAVDVSIVTVGRLVLDVRSGDRHRLGRVANCSTLGDIRIRLGSRQTLGRLHRKQSTCRGGLAVVNVTNCSNVAVGFLAFKYLFGHFSYNT